MRVIKVLFFKRARECYLLAVSASTIQGNDNIRMNIDELRSTSSVITLVIRGLFSFSSILSTRAVVDELSRALAKSFICHLNNRGEIFAKRVT